MKQSMIVFCMIFVSATLYAVPEKKDNIHMFPQAKKGFVRHVVEVPARENENDHKVELLIGKTMNVDCNHHILVGKLETKNLKGWGYTYLEANTISGMRSSTRMACLKPNRDVFVSLAPSPESVRRYNSRMPIVIYVPEGYEVRYRIWSAGKDVKKAEQR